MADTKTRRRRRCQAPPNGRQGSCSEKEREKQKEREKMRYTESEQVEQPVFNSKDSLNGLAYPLSKPGTLSCLSTLFPSRRFSLLFRRGHERRFRVPQKSCTFTLKDIVLCSTLFAILYQKEYNWKKEPEEEAFFIPFTFSLLTFIAQARIFYSSILPLPAEKLFTFFFCCTIRIFSFSRPSKGQKRQKIRSWLQKP